MQNKFVFRLSLEICFLSLLFYYKGTIFLSCFFLCSRCWFFTSIFILCITGITTDFSHNFTRLFFTARMSSTYRSKSKLFHCFFVFFLIIDFYTLFDNLTMFPLHNAFLLLSEYGSIFKLLLHRNHLFWVIFSAIFVNMTKGSRRTALW